MLIVQKFGGSSLADDNLIFNAARKIVEAYDQNNKVVVVLSAQGDTTDDLISHALQINPNASKRELDMLLATGEVQSVALMTMALHKLGRPAVSLNSAQAGLFANNNYSDARLLKINPQRILNELEKHNIVVVTGFQALNSFGDFVTLGRGGSDTSAVALAVALNADLCKIYTDVDGIYSADPRIVPSARKLLNISYDEMLELASLGAVVMHNRSVELAKKYNVKLFVCSSFNPNLGTLIGDDSVEQTLISGIAIDKKIALISVIGFQDEPGMIFKLFALLSRNSICVDLFVQSVGPQNTKDVSFTVARDQLNHTLQILRDNIDFFPYDHLFFDNNVAKLSVVGAGISSNPKIGMLMFEAIYNLGINIKMISTSEIKISILIPLHDADNAANAVHNNLLDV